MEKEGMKRCVLVFWLFLVAATTVEAVNPQTLSAMDAYERAQSLRDQANKIMDGEVTSKEVEAAAGYLNEALDFLATPDVQERAAGNLFLYARRADVLRDLAGAYALMGRRDDALRQLELMEQESWMPGVEIWLREDKRLATLRDEPRFKAVLRTMELADRLWKVPNIATPYKEKLTVEERIAGLSLFWAEARAGFVYFDHVPDLDWDRVYLEYLPRVMSAQDTADYYRVLMQLAPLLHDAHTNIFAPKELQSKFYARPAISTERIGDGVYVRRVNSKSLETRVHPGDEVVAIDGAPVMRYAREVVDPFVSSSTPQDRDVRNFGYQLLMGDEDKPVVLRLRDAGGRERDESVSRKRGDDLTYPEQFQFRKIGDVAYLSLDHFESDAGVKAFEKALPEILGSKALVLDARHNGGGSTSNAQQILSYLIAGALPEAKQRIRAETPWFRAIGSNQVLWRPSPFGGMPVDLKRKEHFRGPVAILVGPETFSAGEDFVMIFDAAKRGILVGSPTAGSTGQPMSFGLPGGGMARICIKRDTYPDGREFVGTGIVPNVVVAMTAEDVRAGRDPVLDRAMAELLKPR
jgi:C-terminal processing protease CtpA/Prc